MLLHRLKNYKTELAMATSLHVNNAKHAYTLFISYFLSLDFKGYLRRQIFITILVKSPTQISSAKTFNY